MRRIPLLLSLLLASSAVVAQSEGVMILKSEQPYVSPFDKTPSGRTAPAAAPSLPAETSAPQGERVEVEVRENDRKETERRAQEFVAKTTQRANGRKAEPARKAVVKKEEARADAAKPAIVAKQEPKAEVKVTPLKSDNKVEASVIPPKNAQNAKPELAPPPAALAVKENGLTSFGSDTPAPVASVSTPAVSTITPPASASTVTSTSATTVAASAPAIAAAALVNPEETPSAVASNDAVRDASESESLLPSWLLKAIMFFVLGGLLMLGGWYWVKRQALYGDPAFQDPWFHPIKNR